MLGVGLFSPKMAAMDEISTPAIALPTPGGAGELPENRRALNGVINQQALLTLSVDQHAGPTLARKPGDPRENFSGAADDRCRALAIQAMGSW